MTARGLARFAVVLATVALALIGFTGTAMAQEPVAENEQLPYPGPLRSVPDGLPAESPGLGASFADVDPTPSSDPAAAAATGGTGGGDSTLAVTGAETESIAAVAIGLLAVGGSVLVTSRRRLTDAAR